MGAEEFRAAADAAIYLGARDCPIAAGKCAFGGFLRVTACGVSTDFHSASLFIICPHWFTRTVLPFIGKTTISAAARVLIRACGMDCLRRGPSAVSPARYRAGRTAAPKRCADDLTHGGGPLRRVGLAPIPIPAQEKAAKIAGWPHLRSELADLGGDGH